MIDAFETNVRIDPDGIFFSYTDREGSRFSYTYYDSRLVSASFARRLHGIGLKRGDVVLVDVPNCPELVFVLLACAYGGFPVALIEHSLPRRRKLAREFEIERSGLPIGLRIDYRGAREMLSVVRDLPDLPSDIVRSVSGRMRGGRPIMGEDQDLIDSTVHFAERAAHLFDRSQLAVIGFDDGRHSDGQDSSRPRARAVPLTWEMLYGAIGTVSSFFEDGAERLWQDSLPFGTASGALSGSLGGKSTRARSVGDSGALPDSASGSMGGSHPSRFTGSVSMRGLKRRAPSVWQCEIALARIEGFQSLLGSVLDRDPLLLYTGLEPEQVLLDVERRRGTHLVVDESQLEDILTIEEWRSDVLPGASSRLELYRGVLLVWCEGCDHAVRRASELGTRLFVGYGMPETSGCMAISSVLDGCDPGLAPLEGYSVQVIDPDEDGRGRLAIAGPGVFDGYLSSNTPRTIDRFFVTNDLAVLEGGRIRIENRSKDMFVSGGQPIFPVEVADVLRHVPGVSAVHVFGVPDSRCGMLPVAALERDDGSLTSQDVADMTRSWFEGFDVPISVFVFDDLPRNAKGKLDRPAIESFFAV